MKSIKLVALRLFCLITFLNLSCSERDDSLELEQKIFAEIFTELIEKTYQDFRKIPAPPAPSLNNSRDEIEKMRQAFKRAEEDYKIYLDTTKFAPLYVIVNDSVNGHKKDELIRIYNEDYHDLGFIDTTLLKKSFKIDLSKIKLKKSFILKYKSDFSNTIDELKTQDEERYSQEERHLRQFSGVFSFNRIYFNEVKEYGVFDMDFNCGKLCGCGYRVFVKKINDIWSIDKIKSLGCS